MKASWRRFAEAYVATLGDKKAAAAAAGYEPKRASAAGSRLLGIPKIAALIEELKAQSTARAVEGAESAREAVLAGIEETIELARKGAAVAGRNGRALVDPKTEEIICKPDIGGMQRGLRLKGEIYALYTERREIVSSMDGKSKEELCMIYLAELLNNPMLLELTCKEETIIRKVLENARRDSGAEGVEASATEPVQPASEAGGVPRGGLH